MRRRFTYRCALLLTTFLLSQSLSACSRALDRPTINEFDQISEQEYIQQLDYLSVKPITTPLPTKVSVMADEVLEVRGTSITLNEGIDSVISKLGSPNRIVDTEYDFDYYIYNNDYSRLLFIAVHNGFIVGYYTDSLDFNFKGIHSGADIHKVEKSLGDTFSMAEVLTQTNDYYTVKILMDKLVSQKVTGIYLLANSIKQEDFTDVVGREVEHLVYDLTNSVRVRNNESILSWSSSAALSARKHSLNMCTNDFFSHLDPAGRSPGERLKTEGISYRTYGENIIAGYGSAVLSSHGWFNSSGHRKNMLNPKFRYLGVGFTYHLESTYLTYITQDFYR